jgi:hypothetical protein
MPKLIPIIPGSVGHRLTMVLAYKAKSQQWLSETIKCSGQAVSQVISGKLKDMRGDGILKEIATVLEVDLLWLSKGLGKPPWASAVPLINVGYYDLLRSIRQEVELKAPMNLLAPLPRGLLPSDITNRNWRPDATLLLEVAGSLNIEVDQESVLMSYRNKMPPQIAMSAIRALQMALDRCDEQDRDKFRQALNWIEKANWE